MKREHVPVRTCVGCLGKHPKDHLIRFVVTGGGTVLGGAGGRGRYLCKDMACYHKALKRKCLKGEGAAEAGGQSDAPMMRAMRAMLDTGEAAGEWHVARGMTGGGAIG